MVYGAIALLATIFSWSTTLYPRSASSRRILWVLTFLVLWLPSALRYDVGYDFSRYQGYEQLYTIYGQGGHIQQGMDIGYVALIKLLWPLSHNPQLMFALTSAFICGLVVRAAALHSDMPWLTIALFVASGLYFESLNIVRQWMAIACLLNALPHCAYKPWQLRHALLFALWIAFAALFHISALVLLVLWPLTQLVRTPARLIAFAIAAALLVVFGRPALDTLASYTRFGAYLGDAGYGAVDAQPETLVLSAVVCSFVLVLTANKSLLFLPASKKHYTGWSATLLVVQVLAVVGAASTFVLPAIVDRAVRYAVPILVYSLPWAITCLPGANRRRAWALIVLALWCAVTFIRIMYGDQYAVVPYRSILW